MTYFGIIQPYWKTRLVEKKKFEESNIRDVRVNSQDFHLGNIWSLDRELQSQLILEKDIARSSSDQRWTDICNIKKKTFDFKEPLKTMFAYKRAIGSDSWHQQ